MESYVPPITPPERAPDYGPDQQKPRWNVFELFKKQPEQAPVAPEVKTPKVIERAPERPVLQPERRKFAATVMALLRGESAAAPTPAYEAAAPEAEAGIAIDRVAVPSRTEIAAVPEAPVTEAPQFIERAKEMGRGVLRLIGRVQQEVHAADRSEQVAAPTDLEPLAVADADIRAAMEELVAPIETIALAAPEAEPDAIDAAVHTGGGGDREFGFLAEAKSPFRRTLEVAASVATIAAREALDVKERAFKRTSSLRKVGVFALGAATAAGFAYTWERMRKVKKEQRALRREHKRFEAEVRAVQASEERRLHELEDSNVQGMTQPERQQYVQDVSEFAHARATEIRTTARLREVVQQPAAVPEQRYAPMAATYERPIMQSEKTSFVERIGSAISSAKDGAGAAIGSAVAVGASLLDGQNDHSQQPLRTAQPAPQQPVPSQPARRTVQAWLWGAVLAISAVIFIFLWSMRIL